MVPETTSRQPMSVVQVALPENAGYQERWRQWQLRNTVTSRRDAKVARITFTVIFAALAVWLGRLLLAPSLLP